MKAKELLSILLSLESNIMNEYTEFCTGAITLGIYKKRKNKVIAKQIKLIEKFKEGS